MSNTLEDFVKDKRVVICGPAQHLQGSGKGRWIDEHNVVVRANQFHVLEHLHDDYGTRTDIMFHNFGTTWMTGLKDTIEKNKDAFDKLQMMVCPMIYGTIGKEDNYMSWTEDHVGDVVSNAKNINENNIPFEWIGVKRYHDYYNRIGCQPYTGVLAILMLAECGVRELNITGFDFYTTDKQYVDGFLNPKDGSPPPRGGSHGPGCAELQLQTIKQLTEDLDYVEADGKLKEIFK